MPHMNPKLHAKIIRKAMELCRINFTTTQNLGICLNCGHVQDGVEPDAVGYECDECGKESVCGPDEVLLGL